MNIKQFKHLYYRAGFGISNSIKVKLANKNKAEIDN